MGSAVSDISII